MLKIFNKGHSCAYEIDQLVRMFYAENEYSIVEDQREALDDIQSSFLVCERIDRSEHVSVSIRWYKEGVVQSAFEELLEHTPTADSHLFERQVKRKLLKGIHKVLSTQRESKSPWGILVGVRPVKIVHERMDAGETLPAILERLTEEYCIRKDKAKLLMDVAQKERPVIEKNDPNAMSIYISIPFCPTRCVYCSFPSNSGKAKMKLVDRYVESLIYELKKVSTGFKDRPLESLYIGGGTPTTLEAEDLKQLLDTVRNHYNTYALKEVTVEAGRPDTITYEKLKVLKACGVDRVCINPQSMNDETIRRIGRKHTSKDVEDVYWMARSMGFRTINMDLILGLPGETLKSVKHTFEYMGKLQPENVTVHTLALKRHAELRHQTSMNHVTDESTVNQMLEYASRAMNSMALEPYYMYRQKYMAGNLENVGYARKGHESVYNIQIMEEKQDILAFGAGAVSKMCFPGEDRFERVPNVKGLEDYLERVDEMAERKLKYRRE